jgi:hypothetical protein
MLALGVTPRPARPNPTLDRMSDPVNVGLAAGELGVYRRKRRDRWTGGELVGWEGLIGRVVPGALLRGSADRREGARHLDVGRHARPHHRVYRRACTRLMTELRTRHGLQPLDTPGYARRRKCKVNLDDLDWDRPNIRRESQRARGAAGNLQLDETIVMGMVEARPGLAPNDPVVPVAQWLRAETEHQSLALVGHMPFLGRLASLLVAGHEQAQVVGFQMGAW